MMSSQWKYLVGYGSNRYEYSSIYLTTNDCPPPPICPISHNSWAQSILGEININLLCFSYVLTTTQYNSHIPKYHVESQENKKSEFCKPLAQCYKTYHRPVHSSAVMFCYWWCMESSVVCRNQNIPVVYHRILILLLSTSVSRSQPRKQLLEIQVDSSKEQVWNRSREQSDFKIFSYEWLFGNAIINNSKDSRNSHSWLNATFFWIEFWSVDSIVEL